MATGERAQAGFGCLSMIIGTIVVATIVALVIFVGIIVMGVVAALVVLGLVVLAVDRVLLALSPKRRERRERRAEQQRTFLGRFGQVPSGTVIDATAVETVEPPDGGRTGRGAPGPRESE